MTGFRIQSPSQVRKIIVVDDSTLTSQANRTGGPAAEPSLLDQVRGNDAVDDAQHLAQARPTARKQETQRIRKAQYPWRTDGSEKTSSTSSAALSAIASALLCLAHPSTRPPCAARRNWGKSRRHQLKATRRPAWQVSRRTHRKPCSRRRHLRESSNSCSTYPGKVIPCARPHGEFRPGSPCGYPP